MKKINGFTLIELMIALVILGVLSTIALPSYMDYVTRAQATEGVSTLAVMRVKMEQYFQDNRTYDGACADGTIAPLPSNLKYFTVSCSDLSDTGYTITATGQGFTYTLNEINERATTTAPDGWPTDDTCWVISKNGTCQ